MQTTKGSGGVFMKVILSPLNARLQKYRGDIPKRGDYANIC